MRLRIFAFRNADSPSPGVVIPGGSHPCRTYLRRTRRPRRGDSRSWRPGNFCRDDLQLTPPADAVAAEGGTAIAVIELYSGARLLVVPAATLPGMLVENAHALAAALS